MQAVVYRRTGAARDVLSIEQLPEPLPGPGEVLVRVAYSGVNPSDVKARAGLGGMAWEAVVPHSDGSGVVAGVGEGVDAAWLGKRVWFFHAQWQRAMGSAAQRVCLPLAQVAELPDGVPLRIGAAIGIPLMTAHHAVHGYGSVAGKTVLVTGGAGNVGFYAIQLARLAGARVAATVSGAEKGELACAAGADLVLDYRDADALGGRLHEFTGGRGVDVIIEVNASHNAPRYPEWLAFGGRVVVYGSHEAEIRFSYRGMMRVFGSVSYFVVYLLPPALQAQLVRDITQLLADGALRHAPQATFAPEQAAEAHEHVEAGRIGKALLKMGG
jgi:NADPH2:quinone reductase